jgi:hypothetical protein
MKLLLLFNDFPVESNVTDLMLSIQNYCKSLNSDDPNIRNILLEIIKKPWLHDLVWIKLAESAIPLINVRCTYKYMYM